MDYASPHWTYTSCLPRCVRLETLDLLRSGGKALFFCFRLVSPPLPLPYPCLNLALPLPYLTLDFPLPLLTAISLVVDSPRILATHTVGLIARDNLRMPRVLDSFTF